MNETENIPTPGAAQGNSGGLVDEGKRHLSDLGGAAKGRVMQRADQRKSQLARELASFSERLKQQGGEGGSSNVSGLVTRAAGYAERASQMLEQRSTDELLQNARAQLRERPAIILGALFVAGFVTARILR
jgi:hypothetical protein